MQPPVELLLADGKGLIVVMDPKLAAQRAAEFLECALGLVAGRIQFGGDFVRATSKNFSSGLVNQIFMDANIYKPYRYGLYATDRLDLGDVVVDLGLRVDHLHSDVMYPNTPARLFTDPLHNGTAGLAALQQVGLTPTAFDSAVAARCQAAITAAEKKANPARNRPR